MSLPGRAWMDGDGRHVWWEHECFKGGQRVTLRWMLPWSDWSAKDGHITPSVVCEVPGCGYHAIPLIGEPPSDWEPRQARPDDIEHS